MKKMMNMKESIKRMVLTGAAVTVMMSLAAPAAIAEEEEEEVVVRDHRDTSQKADPIIRDHRDDSSSPAAEEPQMVCIKAPCPGSSDTSAEEEEPYKDPGIRQCDLTPVECEDAQQDHEEQDEPYEEDPDDTGQCFIKPYCQAPEESGDSAGVVRDHRDGGAGGSKDEEAGSAPGGVKVGVNNPSSASAPKEEAVSGTPADEAEQADNSAIEGDDTCFFDDYMYVEEWDVCMPNSTTGLLLPTLFGIEPLPDSLGGYLGLAGNLVQDPVLGAGVVLDMGLGYVGDALVEFGNTGNFVGWPFQAVGYTLGFIGDVSGMLGTGLGEAAGAVADGVGEVVDAIGDAIGDAAGATYDEIASWF